MEKKNNKIPTILNYNNLDLEHLEYLYPQKMKENNLFSIISYNLSPTKIVPLYLETPILNLLSSITEINNEFYIDLGKSAAYINLNTSRINKVFFYYFLQTHQIKLFYLKELTGTTIANLSLKSIRKTPTVLPSNEEQQKIADILSEADAKIEKEQTQKTQLETLKKGLMQQLLTGKKRVKV